MLALLQRVISAKVVVEGSDVSEIGAGLLVFVCVVNDDDASDVKWMTRKIISLRVFEDDQQKMNYSIQQTAGEILLVSQFTLAANLKKGNRPSFEKAMKPPKANELFGAVIESMSSVVPTKSGIFGADMKIHLVNDGPVTLWLNSRSST